ncbi:MAG: 2,3-bisphosphoglycerate-independent phosphoglycerate mutase, partial [Nitrospinota bacterium]
MRYLVLIGDGMADEALSEVGGATPLEAAATPNMDALAREGMGGGYRAIPEGMATGSDVAILSILGYRPEEEGLRRGPLEALGLGLEQGEGELAFRANLVSLSPAPSGLVMMDHTGGGLRDEEGASLFGVLSGELQAQGEEELRLHHGGSYRGLLFWWPKVEVPPEAQGCSPPHDILGMDILKHLPPLSWGARLLRLITDGQLLLKEHPLNRERLERGELPANSPWFWGGGKREELTAFRQRWGVDGALVAAVPLVKGLGRAAGLEVLSPPGITGRADTSLRAKREAALEALREKELVIVHVATPDEEAHEGDLEGKLSAIEAFDRELVGPLVEALQTDFRVLLLTDHPTLLSTRTHDPSPVPYAIYPARGGRSLLERFRGRDGFSEKLITKGPLL